MIQLTRPTIIPKTLKKRSASDTAKLWTAYHAAKAKKTKKATKRDIVIRKQTYRAKDVKTALREAQHDKCAYCESRPIRSRGQVEHFRPTSGWKHTKGGQLMKPGYFWLAYEWSNLLFSCEMCNDQGHKGNLFPLAGGSTRATPDVTGTSNESPLLINPYDEKPDDHIEWNTDIPKPKKQSAKGRTTIDVFGLDRDVLLMDDRRGLLEDLEGKLQAVENGEVSNRIRTQYIAELKLAVLDEAPYSAMVKANLGNRIAAV